MSSMYGLLSLGRSALSTQKLNIATTGNNIANMANPAYAKQRVEVASNDIVHVGGGLYTGTGVSSKSISRSFDSFTYQRILSEQSRTSFYEAQKSEATAIEGAFNESADGGLRQAMSDFFSGVSQVSANPEGSSERTVVLSNAETLVNRFHSLAQTMNDAVSSADQKVAEDATSINEAAREIALLNRQIAAAEASGSSAGNLRDRREELTRTLATRANITVSEATNGSYTVHIADQILVQDDSYNQLVTTPDPANNNLLGVYLQMGSEQRDLTTSITGGTMGGNLRMRDVTVPGYQTELDNLAFTLVNSFNTQHQAGFDQNGVAGGDFFNPLGVAAGAASLISLSANVEGLPENFAASGTAAAVPGDNANAILLYQLNDQALVSGLYTFSESALVQSSQAGMDASGLDTNLSYQTRVLGELDALQESISGVSSDEEATNMLKFQSAYESAARFISAVQEMMDTLMRL